MNGIGNGVQALSGSLSGRLSAKDKCLLGLMLGLVVLIALLIALVAPRDDDGNTVPSTFSSGARGARAAFLMLRQAGYNVVQSEQPLEEVAAASDKHTVLILADPNFGRIEGQQKVVQTVLDHGGRVLATGLSGGYVLPESHVESNSQGIQGTCSADPNGLDPLAGAGTVHLRPGVNWSPRVSQRTVYTCNGLPVVVRYAVGPGTVVWWASAQPMENGSITQDGNLTLLLRSLGPPEGTRIVWDESLHEPARGLWSYAAGTPVHLLWAQLGLVAVLLVLSFGRRSGPLLPDPVVARDAPLEFVQSLGALYEKAGATSTVVKVAYERLRLLLGRGGETASLLEARLGADVPGLRDTVRQCEQAAYEGATINAGAALRLVRSLWDYERQVEDGGRGGRRGAR